LRTEGTGENYIFAGITDENVPNACHGWVTKEKVPPGKSGTLEGDWGPLTEWYGDFSGGKPIPDTLRWRATVGYYIKAERTVHITDRSGVVEIPVKKAAPGIVDWIKDHPKLVAAGTAGAVGLTYVATQE